MPSFRLSRRPAYRLLVVPSLAVVLGLGGPDRAAATALELSPSSGRPGATVTARGSGFRPRAGGTLAVGSTPVATFRTTRRGSFSVAFVLPFSSAGPKRVSVSVGSRSSQSRFGVKEARTPPFARRATTRPPHGSVLTDAQAAARVRRSSWEPRPQNEENRRAPTAAELAAFRAAQLELFMFEDRITGRFTGTTDEIIQWAAWKWGISEDVVRAMAAQESQWDMDRVGDGGLSFGITQIKRTWQRGTFPLSVRSTAFNLDYHGALMRHYYDGHARWLNNEERGRDYTAHDLWGAVGAWYAGRWHTDDAERYIGEVKRRLAERTWAQAGF